MKSSSAAAALEKAVRARGPAGTAVVHLPGPGSRAGDLLDPEIVNYPRVLKILPPLDDLSIADHKGDNRGRIQGFAPVCCLGLLDADRIVLPTDDVLDVGLEVALRAGTQFAKVRENRVPPLFRPRQHAATPNMPHRVLGEQFAEALHIPGIEGLIPSPDQINILYSSHDRTPFRHPCRVVLGRLKASPGPEPCRRSIGDLRQDMGGYFGTEFGYRVEACTGSQLRHTGELEVLPEIGWGKKKGKLSVDWFLITSAATIRAGHRRG